MLILTWGNDALFEKLNQDIGGWIWKTSSVHYDSGREDFMQSLSFFIYLFCGDLHFDVLVIGLC